MTHAHRPPGWPETVDPPGTEGWESTAVTFLLDVLPEFYRYGTVKRHPVILASIARHLLDGAAEGARQGYRTVRTELAEHVPPHAIDAALLAYRDEGRRLAASAKVAAVIERALRGEAL